MYVIHVRMYKCVLMEDEAESKDCASIVSAYVKVRTYVFMPHQKTLLLHLFTVRLIIGGGRLGFSFQVPS